MDIKKAIADQETKNRRRREIDTLKRDLKQDTTLEGLTLYGPLLRNYVKARLIWEDPNNQKSSKKRTCLSCEVLREDFALWIRQQYGSTILLPPQFRISLPSTIQIVIFEYKHHVQSGYFV